MNTANESVGKPINRVDGRLKVTGGARYASEFPITGVVHAALITSTIPSGTVDHMDIRLAQATPGVIKVYSPFNAPRLPQKPVGDVPSPQDRVLSLLQDANVYYNNQPIGLVVADTLETATHAASFVAVRYLPTTPTLDFERAKPNAYAPKGANRNPTDSHRGDYEAGLATASHVVHATYSTPMENHNPMEPHATTAEWEGDKLTVYDSTQGIFGVQGVLARHFQLPPENVRCICYFTGGGFGCKGSACGTGRHGSARHRPTG